MQAPKGFKEQMPGRPLVAVAVQARRHSGYAYLEQHACPPHLKVFEVGGGERRGWMVNGLIDELLATAFGTRPQHANRMTPLLPKLQKATYQLLPASLNLRP